MNVRSGFNGVSEALPGPCISSGFDRDHPGFIASFVDVLLIGCRNEALTVWAPRCRPLPVIMVFDSSGATLAEWVFFGMSAGPTFIRSIPGNLRCSTNVYPISENAPCGELVT